MTSRTQAIRHAQAVHRHRRAYDDREGPTVRKLGLDLSACDAQAGAEERRYCRGEWALFVAVILLCLFWVWQVYRGLP